MSPWNTRILTYFVIIAPILRSGASPSIDEEMNPNTIRRGSDRNYSPIEEKKKKNSLQRLSSELTSIHFIGDLHSDYHCAKQWVTKTNLIDMSSQPYKWIGKKTDAIVFLGDYVDRGTGVRDILEFVRNLQVTFPDNVVTLLGNHDLWYLFENAVSPANPDFLEEAFPPTYDLTGSYMHVEEYLSSGWPQHRDDDEEILLALNQALQQCIDGTYRKMYFCAPPLSYCQEGDDRDLLSIVPPFKDNPNLARRARRRIAQWREEYANGLASSGLLSWLGSQPIIAVVGNNLIAHGGVSLDVIRSATNLAEKKDMSLSQALNELVNVRFKKYWERQSSQLREKGHNVIEPYLEAQWYAAVEDLVSHREYFDDWDEADKEECNLVENIIDQFDDVDRIVIGHTPHQSTVEYCDGRLVDADSNLSRFYRHYGHSYCPLDEGLRQTMEDQNIELAWKCRQELSNICQGTTSFASRPSTIEPWPLNIQLISNEDNVVLEV